MRTFIEDLRDRWADRSRRIKVAKIRRVFEREGGLTFGTLVSFNVQVCDHPGRCAMGALIAAIGVSDKDISSGGLGFYIPLLKKVYGLEEFEVNEILRVNDDPPSWRSAIWAECGIATRPEVNVRVCVVNDRVARLAAV